MLSLAAAACGGGDDGASGTQTTTVEAVGAAPAVPSGDFMSTRPGAGIAAAGGNPQAIRGDNPCEQPGAESVTIAYIGADLAALEGIGLEGLVLEEPGVVIEAYANEVNFNGGINGQCVEFVNYLWSPTDPAGDFTRICTEMPPLQPVVYFALRVFDPTLQCATIGARIPTIGLFTSPPTATFELTGDRLFVDDGTSDYLLSASLDLALASGVIGADDVIGLAHGGPGMASAVAVIESFGLDNAATAHMPPEYAALELLLQEKRVGLLASGLSEDERAEADRNRAALPPELAAVYGEMEQFFIDAANRFKEAGVTAVVATADWTDFRRLIRAAELVDWAPQWVANDTQPASVVLLEIPSRQAENLVLVSNRRAAGDEIPELDRGCLTLRNTAIAAEPFSHRLHTDAWTLIMATCDYLDVAFSAMTRVQGEVNADTFVEALMATDYEPGFGGQITFGSGDFSGAERFRVLQADPACVLNAWGCMRSTTDWTTHTQPSLASAGTG
ncbi:MAG: hypothetical protein OXI12_15275 [Gammaproteobacteria bacterium]|nr:hypothetical protein [Gammaproteobacteria bacterium]